MATLYVTEQKSIIRKTSDRLIFEKNKEVCGPRSRTIRRPPHAEVCVPPLRGWGWCKCPFPGISSQATFCRRFAAESGNHPHRLRTGIAHTVFGWESLTQLPAGNRSHRPRLF